MRIQIKQINPFKDGNKSKNVAKKIVAEEPAKGIIGTSKTKAICTMENGFFLGSMKYFSTKKARQAALLKFATDLSYDLPPDPFDKTLTRNKILGKALLDPVSGKIIFLSRKLNPDGKCYTTYNQTGLYNGEVGTASKGRQYAAIPHQLAESPELLYIIGKCWNGAVESGCIERNDLVACHIHVVEQVARDDRQSWTSPSVFHVDGEPCTFVILLRRDDNVRGGESFIGERISSVIGKRPANVNKKHIRVETTLMNPFDFLQIDDFAVSHHVNGISSSDGKPASRITLLVDFTPLLPKLTGGVKSQ